MLTLVTTMFAIINISYSLHQHNMRSETYNVDIVSRLIEFEFSAAYTLQLVML